MMQAVINEMNKKMNSTNRMNESANRLFSFMAFSCGKKYSSWIRNQN